MVGILTVFSFANLHTKAMDTTPSQTEPSESEATSESAEKKPYVDRSGLRYEDYILSPENFQYEVYQSRVEIVRYIGTAEVVGVPSVIGEKPVTTIQTNAFVDTVALYVMVPEVLTELQSACMSSNISVRINADTDSPSEIIGPDYREQKETPTFDEESLRAKREEAHAYASQFEKTEEESDLPAILIFGLIVLTIGGVSYYFYRKRR